MNNRIFKSPFRSRSNSNDNVITRPSSTKKDKLKSDQYVGINHLGKNTPNQADEGFPSSFAKKLGFWTKRTSSSKNSKGQQSSAHPSSFLQSKTDSAKNSKDQQSPALPPSFSKTQVSSNRIKGNRDRSRTRSASPFKKYISNKSRQREKRDDEPTQNPFRYSTKNEHENKIHKLVQGMSKMSAYSKDDSTATASTVTASTASSKTGTSRSYYSNDASTTISEGNSDNYDRTCSPYTYHSFKAGKNTFTVDTKYDLIRTVGSGAYGVVISARDTATTSKVAIKMVPNAFHDEIDAKRILREIKLLKHFKHDNIIQILDMMPPLAKKLEDYNDVYIVTDLMETDLHKIIYSKQSLSIDHVQYFMYQMLRALKYIHSANVLHRDLKPSNLLVNSNCNLKICDFGLGRGILSDFGDTDERAEGGGLNLTEYVVTRWYRAPEVMLACNQYGKAIDIWSVGCIFAELLKRKPYFPGDDYLDQLTIISGKLGKLPEEDLDFVTSEKAKKFLRRLPNKVPISLRRQFPGVSPEAIDLLQKMLKIHPGKRITCSEALMHPFFAPYHNPNDEPVHDAPFDFSFENEKLRRPRLQELIWEEVASFRPTCLPIPKKQRDGRMGPYINRCYEV